MDDDQQFCLRWNNHQSTLIAVFDTLLENGTLVDCTLAAEGKFLHAHKVVLSACSPYFESLLSQNYDKHPIFILKDIKYQELKAMMDYMYRGEVNISQDQLGALLKAAESLQIKGLSDNRKGETEPKKSQPLPPKSPPPAPSLPKVQGLTIEHKRREMDDSSRDGSQSPGLRRKKRVRRRSVDEIENHHEASNSSESHHSTPAQNIPSLPATKITDVPEPSTDSKQDLRQRSEESEAQVPNPIKEKLETHSELMLEPKSEYADDTNEENIEDLTLDDEDLSNMEQMDEGAGPSHGNMGEGSGQGFGWHMGNQSQDEVFLAAQEAVGAHRDSQDFRERRANNMHILKFLQGLLDDPENRYDQLLKWEDRDDGVFKIISPNDLALLWGKYKNSRSMNYDKMSRALRYYYRDNILSKCGRLCYKFHWENPLFLVSQFWSARNSDSKTMLSLENFVKVEQSKQD